MEKIDIEELRGRYQEVDMSGRIVSVGDDTVESIRMVAEKVNEIVEYINSVRDQLL